jgi:hypothetical protein
MSTLEHARDRVEPYRQLALLGAAVILAAVLVGWLLLRGSESRPIAKTDVPTLVTAAQLERLADAAEHPVFWAGPKKGFSYELTVTRDGRVYVRYLPHGVSAGNTRADFLVVGTYPKKRSFSDLRRASKREGASWIERDGGGLVVYSSARPTNVYFGSPGADYQVEVYSPDAATARRLALDGTVEPIS